MRVLDFIVTGQRIERDPACDFSGLVSNTSGYLFARFRFSRDWGGCKRVAVFNCGGRDFPAPLAAGNVCEIPAEALKGNVVQVSAVGQKTGYRITTNEVAFLQSVGR